MYNPTEFNEGKISEISYCHRTGKTPTHQVLVIKYGKAMMVTQTRRPVLRERAREAFNNQ